MNTPPIPLLDNPHAPDMFADAAVGQFTLGGIMRITFESARMNHAGTEPGQVSRVVIGRLVMPVEQVKEMATGLLKAIAQQEAGTSHSPSSTLQ